MVRTILDLERAFLLMLHNALMYNASDHIVHIAAMKMLTEDALGAIGSYREARLATDPGREGRDRDRDRGRGRDREKSARDRERQREEGENERYPHTPSLSQGRRRVQWVEEPLSALRKKRDLPEKDTDPARTTRTEMLITCFSCSSVKRATRVGCLFSTLLHDSLFLPLLHPRAVPCHSL